MKFTVNVECSPEEARNFLGLPDVEADAGSADVQEIEQRMVSNIGRRMTGPAIHGADAHGCLWRRYRASEQLQQNVLVAVCSRP